MDFLSCIEQTISDVYKVNSRNTLKEDKTLGRQEIRYERSGKQLIYSLDVAVSGIPQPFPFFKNYPDLKIVSDYVLFTNRKSDNKPFILIFELKKNKLPNKQLKATKQFCCYLMERVNSVFKYKFEPEIRMIGLVEGIKPMSRVDNVKYNDGIFNTPLRFFKIKDLLI
jgi:hypothetical protein